MRVKCLAQEHNTMNRPGLELGPLDWESSMLTIRSPLLLQCVRTITYYQCFEFNSHRIDLLNQYGNFLFIFGTLNALLCNVYPLLTCMYFTNLHVAAVLCYATMVYLYNPSGSQRNLKSNRRWNKSANVGRSTRST